MMTDREFRAAFTGEGQYVEFKRGTSRKELQNSAVAFSNADGGVVLIGVNDDGSIASRALDAGTQGDIHNAMREARDVGRYTLSELDVEGKAVSILSIARRKEGFSQTSEGIIKVRRGTRDEALYGAELVRFINERTHSRYETTALKVKVDAIDPEYRSDVGRALGVGRTTIERLRENELVVDDRLTVAGALYLLRNPRKHLGKAFIEVMRFPDDITTDYDRREEFHGPIHRVLSGAVAWIMSDLGVELVVLGTRRHELPRIPEVVVREVMANALAHRSYEISGTPVRVEIRPSMVVVRSPGGLPEPVTVENMREASSARNLRVIHLLRMFGLAEDAGRGIDVIEDTMEAEMLDPPRFHDHGHEVVVELPIRSAVTPSERAWVMELERRGKLEGIDRLVLVHAARGEALTNRKVREIGNVDSHEAREVLQRLKNMGMLEQFGKRGGATYRLSGSLHAPAGIQLTDDELANVVVTLANDRPISNSVVREATGLDRVAAWKILDRLVSEGRLVRIGSRRGTRYLTP